MEYRKQARAAMNEKISRLTGGGDAVGVDASDWRPSEKLDADVKTGMRPVSRRQFKRGGKVEEKAEGKPAAKRADRAKRKDGGTAIANAIVNRDQKAANAEREGKKHVGGMKSGGRAKRDLGGGLPGGYTGDSVIPSGNGTKSMARQLATNGFKKGGRTGKNVGGAFAPPGAPMAARTTPQPMPMPGLPGKGGPGMWGGKPPGRGGMLPGNPGVGGGGGVSSWSPPRGGATPFGGGSTPSVGMKRGGKAEKKAPEEAVEMVAEEPVEESVENDLGTAVGHAIAAYHRAQERHARKSGGRVGKAMGGGFGEDMNNPKPKADVGKKRGGPNINITINTAPKLPPMPMGGPPMPPPGPAPGGMPPGLAPDMGPPGGPPMGAGGPPPPMGGPGPAMPPQPPFKRGGAVKMHAGAGSGEGRLEKVEKYGRNAHADGGKVGMTAGAGTGEGRLEKIAAYGSKA